MNVKEDIQNQFHNKFQYIDIMIKEKTILHIYIYTIGKKRRNEKKMC